MIIGVGVDLVDMRRIKNLLDRFGNRFTTRVFTKQEQSYANSRKDSLRVYANRFAAKEAAVKALGTGMKEGIGWQDIEVTRAASGAPTLYFYGKAYENLNARVPPGYTGSLHVSFSDEYPYSTAFVVISATHMEYGHL